MYDNDKKIDIVFLLPFDWHSKEAYIGSPPWNATFTSLGSEIRKENFVCICFFGVQYSPHFPVDCSVKN